MKAEKRRLLLTVPAAILCCSLLGGVFGSRVVVASAASEGEVADSIKRFTDVLAVVEQNYADQIDSERAIFSGAIPNLLHTLDPHSQFFDPDSFRQLRDEQKGQYAGVGMQIGTRNGNTVVLAPFPKTPAYKAGLRPGDVIAEVDGEAMDGVNLGEVAKRLRGPAGTQVKISVVRRGVDDMLNFEVTRASIPYPSISSSFFIKPGIGFIRIDRFNETTGRELDKALDDFRMGGLNGLVLDLRKNRGGLLSEGVYVSDKFLERGKTIVSHYGRSSPERKYKAKRGNGGEMFPMVVMVDCDSASASEIVAGALQDHDRALIVGTPTFGKGLVQTVYPMGKTAGLALTTARYYTPSGRLIQRSYDDVSLWKYYSDPCSDQYEPRTDEVKLTDQGRRVYGGGGITPDVRIVESKLNEFQITLWRSYSLQTFAQEYTLQHPNLEPNWEATDAVLEEFRQFLYREKVEFSEADFSENADYIKRTLKREVYVSAYDLHEGEYVKHTLDPDVQKALDLLPDAKELLESSGRVIAQR
jgi:carboxyl-terminal processing protease